MTTVKKRQRSETKEEEDGASGKRGVIASPPIPSHVCNFSPFATRNENFYSLLTRVPNLQALTDLRPACTAWMQAVGRNRSTKPKDWLWHCHDPPSSSHILWPQAGPHLQHHGHSLFSQVNQTTLLLLLLLRPKALSERVGTTETTGRPGLRRHHPVLRGEAGLLRHAGELGIHEWVAASRVGRELAHSLTSRVDECARGCVLRRNT